MDDIPLPAVTMSPHETTRFKLRPDQLVTRVTPTEHIYVLAHFGIPQIDAADWRLDVGGLVDKPLSLTLDDIKAFPKVEIESFIKCAGFPHDATINTRAVSISMALMPKAPSPLTEITCRPGKASEAATA